MLKKGLLTALAAAAVVCMAIPASAETFIAENGVISIDLPNESWKEIEDSATWIALSDGANLITIDHFSNGEKLPDIAVADPHYVNVYEAAFSTQNEVFIITGSVVDAAKIPEICNSIMSVKVLKYDTKLAVKKDNVSINEFSIVPMNETMYTTSAVNVRAGCSTNEQILGTLAEGEAVKVTGKVQKGGADYGWYQISYGSATAYVSASFLKAGKQETEAKVTPTPAPTQTPTPAESGNNATRRYTGNAKTIYDEEGMGFTVYEANDGYWYDGSGFKYNWVTDYYFTSENGGQFTINRPQTLSDQRPTGNSFTVYWTNGNTTSLQPYADGYYYSSEWVRYSTSGDGVYYGNDGTVLYAWDPFENSGNDYSDVNVEGDDYGTDSSDTFDLASDGSNRPVTITFEGGAYYDQDGVEYYNQNDGTFIDENGDSFHYE